MFIPIWLLVICVIVAIPIIILAIIFVGFLFSMIKSNPFG